MPKSASFYTFFFRKSNLLLFSLLSFPLFALQVHAETQKISSSSSQENLSFQNWIKNFRPIALQAGISEKTFDETFAQVKNPDFSTLQKAANQPEFIIPAAEYFNRRLTNSNILTGRQKKQQYQEWLNKIEMRFGVDPHILLAIWSVESNYGAVVNNPKIMRDIINPLAVLAYADDRRRRYAENQLIAAMKILQMGYVQRGQLTGSWAGAMGHTQFIPTSYLAYAVDMENHGWPDIWNSIPDALASAANLLHKNGWKTGQEWGYEVTLPAQKDFSSFIGKRLTLAEWQDLGVKRADGKNYQNLSNNASLLLPDGINGPIFLVMKNFSVLKTYNNADRYALVVGLLADRIRGASALTKAWSHHSPHRK